MTDPIDARSTSPMKRLVQTASLVLCLFAGHGCAGVAATSAARRAVPVIADESLRSFERADPRERLARIMATPEMQGLLRRVGQDTMQGALAAASGEGGGESVTRLVDAITGALARDIRDEIVPSALAAARQELTEPLTSDQRDALVTAVRDGVSEATRASMRSAAEEFPRSMAPALSASLAAALESPELDGAISKVVSDSTRHALVASEDLLREMHEESGGPWLVQRLTRYVAASLVLTFVMGAGALALAVWTVELAKRAKRAEVLAESLLESAAKASEGKPWSEEMLTLLARQMGASRLRDLRSLLGKHQK